jgi:hypothetical protein
MKPDCSRLGLERVDYAVLSIEDTLDQAPVRVFTKDAMGNMCLKLKLTRGAAAAAVFGT